MMKQPLYTVISTEAATLTTGLLTVAEAAASEDMAAKALTAMDNSAITSATTSLAGTPALAQKFRLRKGETR